jgi:hypothetical protein
VRILLVEDEHPDVRRITSALQRGLPGSDLRIVRTEYEFRNAFKDIVLFAPELAVIDLMLPWTTAGPNMPGIPPEVAGSGFRDGGARCCRMLIDEEKIGKIPIILYSGVDQSSLATASAGMPPNVFQFRKDRDETTLIRFVRSILHGEGATDLGMDSVFIVHGHDVEAKETVARFIERVGLRAVILQEQASRGQTVIEKFEDHADVAFAVVLLTPDDVGASAAARDKLNARARQNVIFELGFFVARLGRGNVCALNKGGVEVPSDYTGVIYISLDSAGAWRPQLAAEMRAAGLSVDLNKIY